MTLPFSVLGRCAFKYLVSYAFPLFLSLVKAYKRMALLLFFLQNHGNEYKRSPLFPFLSFFPLMRRMAEKGFPLPPPFTFPRTRHKIDDEKKY